MYTVIVETQKDGEESTGAEAFLAHVDVGEDGEIRHEFGLEVVNYKNRRAFAMIAEPGQIFTTCRWRSNGENFIGGDLWFTIDVDGAIYPLDKSEALALLAATRWEGAVPGYPSTNFIERRTPPSDIFCRRNDIIPAAPPKRPLD